MTAGSWLVVALLAGAALVVAWPVRSSRRRRRRVLGPPPDVIGSPVSASLMRAIGWTSLRGRASRRGRTGFVGVPGPTGSTGTGLSTGATGAGLDRGASVGRRALWQVTAARPRRVVLLVGFVGAGTGGLTAGPVAAALLAGYGMLAARAVYRRRAAGRIVRERRHRLDRLGAFAADLRAGLPSPTLDPTITSAAADLLGGPGPTPAFGIRPAAGRRPGAGPSAPPTTGTRSPPPDGGRAGSSDVPAGFSPAPRPDEVTPGDDPTGTDRLERLARSAVRLADRTGAPLAELLERVEADARATDRGLAGAAAQAAGANATALLLAGLPLGGIALGYGIGVDPLAVLLHTPVGAGCALAAMGLQAGGLLWAERLGATPGGSG
ncbi:hypothetical protein [Micromonospora rifamycinica]|uniref:Tight adherence protein B n=1 Tax=Micromonospora rifamycinica TaxID=291594 RepID=A0A109IQ85_9ACTN|nr:hypothetical protein AWV63_00475 [Micromonospora rifamycinica]SCG67940.1 tight adherence protein B [Micromonospora rifamycinica]